MDSKKVLIIIGIVIIVLLAVLIGLVAGLFLGGRTNPVQSVAEAPLKSINITADDTAEKPSQNFVLDTGDPEPTDEPERTSEEPAIAEPRTAEPTAEPTEEPTAEPTEEPEQEETFQWTDKGIPFSVTVPKGKYKFDPNSKTHIVKTIPSGGKKSFYFAYIIYSVDPVSKKYTKLDDYVFRCGDVTFQGYNYKNEKFYIVGKAGDYWIEFYSIHMEDLETKKELIQTFFNGLTITLE